MLQHLAVTVPGWPVILVEQDFAPALPAQLPHPNLRTTFVYNPGGFNKSWGFNVGVRLSATPLLLFTDADLVLTNGWLAAHAVLAQRQALAAKPYRHWLDLDAEETARLIQNQETPAALSQRLLAAGTRHRESRGEFPPFCAGAFFITRDAFAQLGGWDERFVGWGAEDDAFSYRLERARIPAAQVDEAPVLHLFHPRAVDAAVQSGQYQQNRWLLDRYRDMDDARLLRLAEVQSQVFGYAEKYRPFSER